MLENRGDEVIHDIFTRLNQTFITPIDPEDIHNVSSALDDVLDGIEDTSHRLVSYRIDPIPPTMITLAELVATCAKSLKNAIEALEKNGPILAHCIEINRIENEADRIGRSAVVIRAAHARGEGVHIRCIEDGHFRHPDTRPLCVPPDGLHQPALPRMGRLLE